MTTTGLRKIVRIDQAECDGCGACVEFCPEGALELTDGKARLLADSLCDGLGSCVDVCLTGAIILEEREGAVFDGIRLGTRGRLDTGNATSDSARGNETVLQQRLTACCQASPCGRICERLIKQPGKAGVYCVDIETGEKVHLYDALADPSFACPKGRF